MPGMDRESLEKKLERSNVQARNLLWEFLLVNSGVSESLFPARLQLGSVWQCDGGEAKTSAPGRQQPRVLDWTRLLIPEPDER